MAIPTYITKENILKAISVIDEIGIDNVRQSTKYDLLYNNHRYPPKEVLRYAHKDCTGQILRGFSGGDETNNYLIKLGFTIVQKNNKTPIELNYSKNIK